MTIRNTFNSGTGKRPTGLANNHTHIATFVPYFRESANISNSIFLECLLWNIHDKFEPRPIDFLGESSWAHLAKEINDIALEVRQQDKRIKR